MVTIRACLSWGLGSLQKTPWIICTYNFITVGRRCLETYSSHTPTNFKMNITAFKTQLALSLHISLVSPNNFIKIIVNNKGRGQCSRWLVLITRGSHILSNKVCSANMDKINRNIRVVSSVMIFIFWIKLPTSLFKYKN